MFAHKTFTYLAIIHRFAKVKYTGRVISPKFYAPNILDYTIPYCTSQNFGKNNAKQVVKNS